MLETLGEDYVLTARAKGLPNWAIVWKHGLRNAMLPLITLIALSLGYIVAGAIVVEDVFSYPGIGLATIDALNKRDYPVLEGIFLVLTLAVIAANFVADILYFCLRSAGDHVSTAVETAAQAELADQPIIAAARVPPHGRVRPAGVLRRRVGGDRLLADRDLRARCSSPTASPSRSAGSTSRPAAQHWLGTDDGGIDVFSRADRRRAGVDAGRVRRRGRGHVDRRCWSG